MPHKLFPSQMDNEQIYLVVREHWFHLLLKFLVWVFFAAALVLFNRYTKTNLPDIYLGFPGQVVALFVQIYTLFLVLSLFLIWVFHYLNIQIITNVRVVDITQEGLFSRTVSELHIDKIEDATSERNGIFGTIFDYGNVYVQTAGSLDRFDFHNIPNPSAIEKTILDLYQQNSNFAKDAA